MSLISLIQPLYNKLATELSAMETAAGPTLESAGSVLVELEAYVKNVCLQASTVTAAQAHALVDPEVSRVLSLLSPFVQNTTVWALIQAVVLALVNTTIQLAFPGTGGTGAASATTGSPNPTLIVGNTVTASQGISTQP